MNLIVAINYNGKCNQVQVWLDPVSPQMVLSRRLAHAQAEGRGMRARLDWYCK
jgi:hypothetical protein